MFFATYLNMYRNPAIFLKYFFEFFSNLGDFFKKLLNFLQFFFWNFCQRFQILNSKEKEEKSWCLPGVIVNCEFIFLRTSWNIHNIFVLMYRYDFE
jgi:hypothetical protein